jgi:hypothetical protein
MEKNNYDDLDTAMLDDNYESEILEHYHSDAGYANPTYELSSDNPSSSGIEDIIDGGNKQRLEIDRKLSEENKIIPTMTKIIYSIPSFCKMSCLVLLK